MCLDNHFFLEYYLLPYCLILQIMLQSLLKMLFKNKTVRYFPCENADQTKICTSKAEEKCDVLLDNMSEHSKCYNHSLRCLQ